MKSQIMAIQHPCAPLDTPVLTPWKLMRPLDLLLHNQPLLRPHLVKLPSILLNQKCLEQITLFRQQPMLRLHLAIPLPRPRIHFMAHPFLPHQRRVITPQPPTPPLQLSHPLLLVMTPMAYSAGVPSDRLLQTSLILTMVLALPEFLPGTGI